VCFKGDSGASYQQSQLLQGVCERRETDLYIRIVPGTEHANASHALAMLRARRERPSPSRAAEERNELMVLPLAASSARSSFLFTPPPRRCT
jgi:hypothetical protein